MRVEISAEAERDLRQITLHIARDSVSHAAKFIQRLRKACLDLGEFPERFPFAPRFEQERIRRRITRNYLIFYRVEEERVVVLHVLHGATDYADLLKIKR